MTTQELHSLLSQLPIAPWTARGNRVLAGDRTVAIITAQRAPLAALIADNLARLPDLLVERVELDEKGEEEAVRLQARVDVLEEELADLKADLERAQDEAAGLRADLAEAQKALDEVAR